MPPLERLTINGFAGIDGFELDVRPFTILIGPQSVGKSIVAKLLYLFRSVPQNLYLEALRDTDLSAEEALLEHFSRILPSPTHARRSAAILYVMGKVQFRITHAGSSEGSWEVEVPVGIRRAFGTLRETLQEERDNEEGIYDANELAKEAYRDRIRKLWPEAETRPRFVPAGRSFYSQIKQDQASYYESASIDPFVAEFAKFLSSLKVRRRKRQVLPTAEAAATLGQHLLSGRYLREGNDEFIHSEDGRKLPPNLWSSGQQEAQPLTLLLQRYCEGYLLPASLFIEEPEAHLFPDSQRLMTEFIALAFVANQPGMQIFITTHSPYILTTVNNLLLGGQLYGRKLKLKERTILQKSTPEDRALSVGSVGAYYMDRDGCRPILDPETGLIGSSEIDAVSGRLNEEFDALLELDRR